MSKRVYYMFTILSIILLSLTLQSITPVLGLNVIITDPENDVYRLHVTPSSQDVSKGDYHDEIDIVKLEINGQFVNLTFAGNIADWESNDSVQTEAEIMLHENFTGSYMESLMIYPYYLIYYDNWTNFELGYRVFFVLKIEDSPWRLFWNGSEWVADEDEAMDIGSASDKSIVANVPPGAFVIPDNITYIAASGCNEAIGMYEMIGYSDIAPNKYDPLASNGGEIPSYNLFIVVGFLVGVCLIIIRKQIKSN